MSNGQQFYKCTHSISINHLLYIPLKTHTIYITIRFNGHSYAYTADTDKTRLSCLVGGVNRISDKSRLFSVVLNTLESEQFCPVLSAVWTRLQTSPSCKLETGSRQDKTLFTPHFETGQTVSKFSVTDSLDMLSVLYTPPTWTWQDS